MLEPSEKEKKTMLARLLQERRKALKISQAVACGRLGVAKGTYQAWERGAALPDSVRLPAVAQFLGLPSTSELWRVLEGTDSPSSVAARQVQDLVCAIEGMTTNDLKTLNLAIAQKLAIAD